MVLSQKRGRTSSPGWEAAPESKLLTILSDLFQNFKYQIRKYENTDCSFYVSLECMIVLEFFISS